MSENDHSGPDAPLTRRELRELERRRVLEASAALAELAASETVPSPAGPAPTSGREAWQPPAAPASDGPALTRRELRRRNVEVEPVRLSVPSQSPAPAMEGSAAEVDASGVASIPVSTIREHAQDKAHLPASALAAAVQGRRAGMRDAVAAAARPQPVQAVAAGGLALETRAPAALEAQPGSAPERDAEPAVVTDGFGMPAVFMDAPVLPALRPIEEIEAELVRVALGGSPVGDRPASPEPLEPTGPQGPSADPGVAAEPVAGSGGPFEPGAVHEPAAHEPAAWEPGAWEPGVWEPAADVEPLELVVNLEPDDAEPRDGEVYHLDADPHDAAVTPYDLDADPHDAAVTPYDLDADPHDAAVTPYDLDADPGRPATPAAEPAEPGVAPAAVTFEPARTATVPSPRTVTSQRLGLEHAAAMAAPVSTRPRSRVAPPNPQPVSGDVLKVPAGRWQAVYGAWIGVAAIAVWALGPVALVLGLWSLVQARAEGYGRGRPFTAIAGGVVGTILGVLFLLNAPG